MALPALTRAYHVRRDCLMPDRSTLWSLKAHLMDQLTTGSIGSTARDTASVWT